MMVNNIGWDSEQYDALMKQLEDSGVSHKDAHISLAVLRERLVSQDGPTGPDGATDPSLDRVPTAHEQAGERLKDVAMESMKAAPKDEGMLTKAGPNRPADLYPQSMRVGSKIFHIYWWDDQEWERDQSLGSDNKGKTQPESSSVHIRTSIRYEHASNIEAMYGLQDMAETLIHEALHCMYIESMLDKNPRSKNKYDQEEYTVQVLAPQVAGFMADNPDLVAWVQAARTA